MFHHCARRPLTSPPLPQHLLHFCFKTCQFDRNPANASPGHSVLASSRLLSAILSRSSLMRLILAQLVRIKQRFAKPPLIKCEARPEGRRRRAKVSAVQPKLLDPDADPPPQQSSQSGCSPFKLAEMLLY